jgi:rare lipoprotein A (peptidoglycan hydrolase)
MSALLAAVLAAIPFMHHAPVHHHHHRRRDPWQHWQTAVASWYYDQGETACGFHARYGIANLTLPCGTPVRLCFDGCVTATVQDRGPYITGRLFDLNPNTREAIGCTGLCGLEGGTLRYAIGRPPTL